MVDVEEKQQVIPYEDIENSKLERSVAMEILMLNMAAIMNVNSLRESAKFIEYDDILERVSTQIMSIGDLIFAVSKVTPEEFAAHFKECVSSGRTVREFREVDDGEGRMFQ